MPIPVTGDKKKFVGDSRSRRKKHTITVGDKTTKVKRSEDEAWLTEPLDEETQQKQNAPREEVVKEN